MRAWMNAVTGDYGPAAQGAVFGGLAILGTVASLAGTAMSVMGGIQAGNAAEQEAKFEAAQLQRKADEERAAAQREAADKQKEGMLAQSRQQALAAASGGGAGIDSPTIVKLMGDTAGQTEFNREGAMYVGENRARGYMDQAAARLASGKSAKRGSLIGAFGTAFSGLGNAAEGWSKYR